MTTLPPPLLFVGLCLPARAALAFAVLRAPRRATPWIVVPLVLFAVAQAVLHVTGGRTTGWETGGRPIWWDAWRPVHASLYAAAAVALCAGAARAAGAILALDLIVAVVASLHHYHGKK